MDLRAGPTRNVKRRTSRLCNRRTPTHLPAGIEGVRTHASISLLRTSAVVFCFASIGEWRSRSLEDLFSKGRGGSDRLGPYWATVTDQLLTPCSKCFSGASTLNGTPGGDRWARFLGGQIGWLSELLHRFEVDCSGSGNLKMQTHGKREKIPSNGKRTTKATSAQRPRPPRSGARKHTSHALARTRPLP